MIGGFATPAWLLLLPLALLPLLRRRGDVVAFPAIGWLPASRKGKWLDRAGRVLAALLIGCVVVGLAAPRQGPTTVERWARGAEIVIAFDRSSSMDEYLRNINLAGRNELIDRVTKNEAVRSALLDFIARRPSDRYALTMFGTAPMRVLPMTDDVAAIRAGLQATAIGRGLPRTDMGAVLRSAIAEFDDRPYAGSRAILLVSDGGAYLDADTRRSVAEGLQRSRIALYFLYIRSSTHAPDLQATGSRGRAAANAGSGRNGGSGGSGGSGGDGGDGGSSSEAETVAEIALHRFFQSLPTPYFVFQANDPAAIDAAIAEFDQQQNLPLLVQEQVPRLDYQRAILMAAAVLGALLLAFRAIKLEALR